MRKPKVPLRRCLSIGHRRIPITVVCNMHIWLRLGIVRVRNKSPDEARVSRAAENGTAKQRSVEWKVWKHEIPKENPVKTITLLPQSGERNIYFAVQFCWKILPKTRVILLLPLPSFVANLHTVHVTCTYQTTLFSTRGQQFLSASSTSIPTGEKTSLSKHLW